MPITLKNNQIDLDYYEGVIVYNSLIDETYLASIIDATKPEYFNNQNIKFEYICDDMSKRIVLVNLVKKSFSVKDDIITISLYDITELLEMENKQTADQFKNVLLCSLSHE